MNIKRTKFFTVMLFAALTVFSACKDNDPVDGEIIAKEQEIIEGQITSTKTLDANKVYLLRGYVRVMAGGKLVIPAGTVIKGEKATKAALFIEKDGDIEANGTASNPIVFTSDQAVGVKKEGDWAGIVIAGKSTVNTADGTAKYEGGILGAGVAEYGGNVPADNSGSFTYVRIEFAGYPVEADKELNGLTLCGVGSGTTIHHVQVSYGGDDGFEFFGGTVNASHLVVYRTVDDDFDFDQGYTGKIQYGISVKDPNLADKSVSKAIELENKGAVTGGVYTKPIISNFTFIGPGASSNANHGAAIHYGLNSRMVLANSIIVNARGNAVEFTEFPAAEALAGRAGFSNNLVFGNAANYGLSGTVTSFADAAALATFAGTKGNATVANLDAAGFNSIELGSPNLTLKASSPANGKAKFEGELATGFTVETFAGAMGTVNWTNGWANWDPKNTTY
ncbi:hypothetical protein ACFSJU_00480 [Paradesertivirga mongoliensis]|uniref:T9SS C-terminal target domain-containing protein n=1 Tax=Paradesertivirga mongoliensis TaxID=2100740 RepID=A0ABW4ZGN4_9SPHI|nr:hypothetical protein [Pedobacter mongoliensis]